jgi:DNA polymerase elongation subunit (family B)
MLTFKLTNIYNNKNKIYIFHRPDKELKIYTDYSNKPYYYRPDNKNGNINGYFGGKFTKTICRDPYMIKSSAPYGSAESDLNYCKQYLLDKVSIEKANLKWVVLDIETASKVVPNPAIAPDAVTCITVYDNYSEQYKTFWLEDYKTEYLMLDAFSHYLADLRVDIIIGFNINGYDFPYLVNRFKDFGKIVSPIGEVHYKTGYPIGVGVLDYYTTIKKIYKYKRNTLDFIYSTEFKKELDTTKYRFDVLAPIIKEKNIFDVRKIVELEKKLNLIPYVDELRRITKTTWDDLDYYSLMIDNLILQEARKKNVVLPSKPSEEEKIKRSEEEFVGGYVYAIPGRYENVVLVDASGMYPSLINTFNLDPKNLTDKLGPDVVKVNNVYIKQNTQAIVPTVCRKLVNSRKEIQKLLETKTGDEYEILKKKDDAHKALNNSLYGNLCFRSSRIYRLEIASTITYLARFLIRYTRFYLRKKSIVGIANDTDSGFFITPGNPQDVVNICNNEIIPRWLKHFGKTEGNIIFKYEGYFTELVFYAKKNYVGNFIKANGEKKFIERGVGTVRRDTSKFQERFLETINNYVLEGKDEQFILSWIKTEADNFKNNSIIDISAPFQLNNNDYDSEPVFIRASNYTEEIIPGFKNQWHDYLYYCYVEPFGESQRTSSRMLKNKETGKKEKKTSTTTVLKNVLAFDGSDTTIIKAIDWKKMIEKNIYDKSERIFEAMNWDLNELKLVCGQLKVKKEKKEKIFDTIFGCEVEVCKQNDKQICENKNEDPCLCPKNNDNSIYENEDLIKTDELQKTQPYYSE